MKPLFSTVFLTLAAVVLAACGGAATPETAPPRPNILWITVEDMSPRLGAYGDAVVTSPNIDRLAAEGMRYTRAFSISGVCAPSRAALITGMYPTSIGTHHMRTSHVAPGLPGPYVAVPPPEVKAFTEYLRAAGYYTSNNAKTDYQFASPRDARQPLTAWDASGRNAHWRGRQPGQPFFAVFNSNRTHESRVWPNPDEAPMLDPAAVDVPPYYPDTPVVRQDLARHYDNIHRVDRWVGEILQQLEDDALADSTIVFFYSDHGDGLPRAKRWPYDSGIHVPLIIRWPGGLDPGAVEDRLVSFVDFGPTVLSLAGVPIPDYIQGQAFLGDQAAPPRSFVYAARDRMDEVYDRIRAVRDGRFKYIRNFEPEKPYVQPIAYRNRMPLMQELLRLHESGQLDGPQALWFRPTKPVEELYDTDADPHEIDNLADDPAYGEVLERMQAALTRWMDETNDMGEIPEAEMIAQMWPGGVQPKTAAPEISPSGGALPASTTVEITCSTEGASIAYTMEEGEDPHWLLYTGPLDVRHTTTLRARAIRYGYQESAETAAVYTFHGRDAPRRVSTNGGASS